MFTKISALALATLLTAVPVSLRPSETIGGGGFTVTLNKATAADLEISRRRTAVVKRRYVRVARVYDAVCDGPYVGGGWNGGTYYGGPFMDVRCYGQIPWGPPPAVSYWWW